MSETNLPVNERIARAIEFERDNPPYFPEDRFYLGMSDAARIARETSPWIAVEDGLPELDKPVLALWRMLPGYRRNDESDYRQTVTTCMEVDPEHFGKSREWCGHLYPEEVVAWQALPRTSLPKGDARDG